MCRAVPALMLLTACNNGSDPAKGRGIGERHDKSSKSPVTSLSSVGQIAQPPLTADKNDDSTERAFLEYEVTHNVHGPFSMDIRGQLERVNAVAHWAVNAQLRTQRLAPSWEEKYQGWMEPAFLAPSTDTFLAFAQVADEFHITPQMLYSDRLKYTGKPIRFTGRLQRVRYMKNPKGAISLVSTRFGSKTLWLLVFSEYAATPDIGSSVDVLGYVAPSVENIFQVEPRDIMPIAALQIVKGGSVDRVRKDYDITSKLPGMAPAVALMDLVSIIKRVK